MPSDLGSTARAVRRGDRPALGCCAIRPHGCRFRPFGSIRPDTVGAHRRRDRGGGDVQGRVRSTTVRFAAAGVLTLATLGTAVATGPAAGAAPQRIARQQGAPAHVHYLPVPGAKPAHIQGQLIYHGGNVMYKSSTTYAIFWEPPKLQDGSAAYVAPTYNADILQYFNDIGGTGLYNNNTQYYQGSGNNQKFIKNVSTLGGSWVDTAAYPKSGCTDPATPGNCLTDAQIQAEVSHAISVNGWTANDQNIFLAFTARGEGSCFGTSGSCAFTTYCAYHGDFGAGGATIYANMPYGATIYYARRPSCTREVRFPHVLDSDIEVNIVSHEQIEATTDPHLNAWYDASGEEIGDLCVYNYGTKDEDGGLANQKWNGRYYLMQMEWDNMQTGCVQDGP